jgi:hypothetical protein
MDSQDSKLNGILTKLPIPLIVFGVLLLGVAALQFSGDPVGFYFSYLFAFIYFLTITLGSLFFVIVQHLTRAGWSVVVRRIPETLAKNFPLMAVLFIPILLSVYIHPEGHHSILYHWADKLAVAKDTVLTAKSPYLNVTFWTIRAVVFFTLWILLANYFYKNSRKQDENGDAAITTRFQRVATYAIVIYALTQSFAMIDWVMSLMPHWYSTIFGVYFFAGSALITMSTILLFSHLFRFSGTATGIITREHNHDLGKLLFGFNVFWNYIAFSQYMLIWYASIPEETVFYISRFQGTWLNVSILLAAGHLAVPILLFMSRIPKRNYNMNLAMVCWMFFIHAVDMYWIIKPVGSPHGIHITLTDVCCFLGIGSLFFGFALLRMKKAPVYPIQDPRLQDSIHFENA